MLDPTWAFIFGSIGAGVIACLWMALWDRRSLEMRKGHD
jgi:hypothetical protein